MSTARCSLDRLNQSCGSHSLPQSEDFGAVCGNSESAEGSTPADRADTRLCCPLQFAQGTTSISIQSLLLRDPDSESVFVWSAGQIFTHKWSLQIFFVFFCLLQAEKHKPLTYYHRRKLLVAEKLNCVLLLSTRVVFGDLWGRRRCVPQPCPFCQGRWRASVLCCAVWLLKVWPGWFRSLETPASLFLSPCSALTGRSEHTAFS